MEEMIKSEITNKYYKPSKVVRILNIQQVIAYLNMGVELLDIYTSIDKKTDNKVLVFLFDRESSRYAYDLWCRREAI